MVLAVTKGGSFSASAVETKMSIPGRSDSPFGVVYCWLKPFFKDSEISRQSDWTKLRKLVHEP